LLKIYLDVADKESMKVSWLILILFSIAGCKVSYDKTHVESGSSNSGGTSGFYILAKVCLEGAYDQAATTAAGQLTHKSTLNSYLPISNPDTTYLTDSFLNKFPYLLDQYTIPGPMGSSLDRVMVEVFQDVNGQKDLISQQVGRLEPDGTMYVAVEYFGDGDYYLNIIHRNHLAVGNELPFTVSDGYGSIDFTDQSTAYLGEPTKTPYVFKNGGTIKCLLAGDLTFDHDDDGVVEIDGLDLTKLESTITNVVPNFTCPGPLSSVVLSGYKISDLDFDGQTQACDPLGNPIADKMIIQNNLGKISEIHKDSY
jgi:hypothetical protein